jgi:hypothetical protein
MLFSTNAHRNVISQPCSNCCCHTDGLVLAVPMGLPNKLEAFTRLGLQERATHPPTSCSCTTATHAASALSSFGRTLCVIISGATIAYIWVGFMPAATLVQWLWGCSSRCHFLFLLCSCAECLQQYIDEQHHSCTGCNLETCVVCCGGTEGGGTELCDVCVLHVATFQGRGGGTACDAVQSQTCCVQLYCFKVHSVFGPS